MNDNTKPQKTLVELNTITDKLVDAIFSVHRTMGPGFKESVYHACLIEELELRKIPYVSELKLPVIYKGKELDKFFKIDLLIEDEIIVELKAVSELHELDHAQILSYMKLSNKRIGYLVNFNVVLMKFGINRKRLDSGSQFRPSAA